MEQSWTLIISLSKEEVFFFFYVRFLMYLKGIYLNSYPEHTVLVAYFNFPSKCLNILTTHFRKYFMEILHTAMIQLGCPMIKVGELAY